jgi:hypothetical protein
MLMGGRHIIAVYILIMLLMTFSVAQAKEGPGDLVLGASCTAGGLSSSFSNAGTSSYLRITAVDPSVNRLRIVDTKNRVYYDARPRLSEVIYVPPSVYQATIWSAYGNSPANAIKGVFVNAPGPAAIAPVSTPRPAQSPRQTPYVAPGYNNYPYYTTRPPYQPTTQPTPRATSVTDPNYLKQQKSVTDPGYQNSQYKVTDPNYRKKQKTVNDSGK